MSYKYIFSFHEGDGKNKKLLGGKGAGLCEMTQIGLNVPPGFVISNDACLAFLDSTNDNLPPGLMDDVKAHIKDLEKATGKGFGDPDNPVACLGSIGIGPINARDDGHYPQPWPKLADCAWVGKTDSK